MYVKSVHFKNVKAFADLEFEFGHEGKYAGWNVFVGGNASGKSTVLKGIALALAGPEAGSKLMDTTAGWVRRGELHGSVVVELVWDKQHDMFRSGSRVTSNILTAAVEWSKPSLDLTEGFRKANVKGKQITLVERGLWDWYARGWFCAGYGPLRRLGGSSFGARLNATSSYKAVSRLLTLFREDAALSESEEWLKHLRALVLEFEHTWDVEIIDAQVTIKKKSRRNVRGTVMSKEFYSQLAESKDRALFDSVKLMLNDGLLPHDLKITEVTVEQVLLKGTDGLELPIRDLSDGCRIVYALILDLIRHFAEIYGASDLFVQSPEGRWQINKPGVVLLDEAEAHLHPSWQQTLPEWLKTRFPQVQFIVSTHSPLIVQAADPGGVYVLPLQNETNRKPRRLTEQEYLRIKLGRAEKILLGSAFGLQHSRSSWANAQIERWQWLDAKLDEGEKLTPKERAEYNKLKKQMDVIFEPVWEEEIK